MRTLRRVSLIANFGAFLCVITFKILFIEAGKYIAS